MRFQVTRRQVIKAMKTEPLVGGSWFNYDTDLNGNPIKVKGVKNNVKCEVCAVGGLLSTAIGKKCELDILDEVPERVVREARAEAVYDEDFNRIEAPSKRASVKDVVKFAELAAKKIGPLSALSTLFEKLYSKRSMRRKNRRANAKLRKVLIGFVKKNFPTKLKIDTNTSRL